MNLKTVPFNKEEHNRKDFDCENKSLNLYIKQFVSQDIKRDLTVCHVYLKNDRAVAFYTLSSASIDINLFPDKLRKKLGIKYFALGAKPNDD